MTYESVGAKRQNYQCLECGHFDSAVIFENEGTPEALQCADCKSGSGIPTIHDMIRAGKGMRPVSQEHRDRYDVWTSPRDYQRLGITRDPVSVVENESNAVN